MPEKIYDDAERVGFTHSTVMGTPIGLVKEFLETLINENKEDIIEKKYIFIKKHYLNLCNEHIQLYRYDGIGMAEKFVLNYLLQLRKNEYRALIEVDKDCYAIDAMIWKRKIKEYLNGNSYMIFTIAITGSSEYKEEMLDENLIPDNIKSIKNRSHLDYNLNPEEKELVSLKIKHDYDYELTVYIRSMYQSMFGEISELFMQFLQEKVDKAELEYKKVNGFTD